MADDDRLDDDKLDDVQEKIDQAREAAEDDGILIDDDEPRFVDSGTIRPDQDDQTIVP